MATITGRPKMMGAVQVFQWEKRILKEEKCLLRDYKKPEKSGGGRSSRSHKEASKSAPSLHRSSSDAGSASSVRSSSRRRRGKIPDDLVPGTNFDLRDTNLLVIRPKHQTDGRLPQLKFDTTQVQAMWVPGVGVEPGFYTNHRPVFYFQEQDHRRPPPLRKNIPGTLTHTGESCLAGF
eukprot:TRINITY_DN21381_c1_g2_i1.p1 TRINITY_DN21381_c1_g2~~TRINITY_DN21381_c1_g2_i1.p1  ORF type:complete len:178 (+),score=30.76 TRINITY_DN21381_c1_g2_i1:88-621(+)